MTERDPTPILEGPALVSDSEDREDQLKNIRPRGGYTRRQVLSIAVNGGLAGVLALALKRARISPADILGQNVGRETGEEKLKRREADWAYLLSGPATGFFIPRTFALYGKDEGVDINNKDTWDNTKIAVYFEGLKNLVEHLQTSDGRDELVKTIEETADQMNVPTMSGWGTILKDEEWEAAGYPAEYTNEEEVLTGFFGQGLVYSEMELAIFKGALDLWKTGNSAIEFEGRTTTFKDLVNRYNQENQIEVIPLP